MSIKVAILGTKPTSYWPLDDLVGSWCHDELGLHDASVPDEGVSLAVIPFGESQAPNFEGLGNYLTIESDQKILACLCERAKRHRMDLSAGTRQRANCRIDRSVRSFRGEGS
jgi:hypothetical protein